MAARFAALAAPQCSRPAAKPRMLGTELWSGEASVSTTPALRGAWFSAVSDARFRQFSAAIARPASAASPIRIATLGYDSVLLTLRVARDWKPGKAFPTAQAAR
jgi:branched-chain amino acid transport system substrate-binding protein